MPKDDSFDVVTGAFSFTGRYITQRLLKNGRRVLSLTNSPAQSNPFGSDVESAPFNFDDPEALTKSLFGARYLFNTYWMRHDPHSKKFKTAVDNTRILFEAAKKAGVSRIIHVSVLNPSFDAPSGYYWGKKVIEQDLRALGVSYGIVRPAVIFGEESPFIGNLAYLLKNMNYFGIPGNGKYEIRPVFVEDLADLMLKQAMTTDNVVTPAIGPETFEYREFIKLLNKSVNGQAKIMRLPLFLSMIGLKMARYMFKDVIVTKEELRCLMEGYLSIDAPATGQTKFSEWLDAFGSQIGDRFYRESRGE